MHAEYIDEVHTYTHTHTHTHTHTQASKQESGGESLQAIGERGKRDHDGGRGRQEHAGVGQPRLPDEWDGGVRIVMTQWVRYHQKAQVVVPEYVYTVCTRVCAPTRVRACVCVITRT